MHMALFNGPGDPEEAKVSKDVELRNTKGVSNSQFIPCSFSYTPDKVYSSAHIGLFLFMLLLKLIFICLSDIYTVSLVTVWTQTCSMRLGFNATSASSNVSPFSDIPLHIKSTYIYRYIPNSSRFASECFARHAQITQAFQASSATLLRAP